MREVTSGWKGKLLGLHELEAITERIMGVEPLKPWEIRVPLNIDSMIRKMFGQGVKITNEDAGMCLRRCCEWIFDAEVDL
jgi:hypothetical protein